MELMIPKDEAIKILRLRLQELNEYGFNPKVWKDRTVLDLKQIFGVLGDQWLQVSAIYFDTEIMSQKAQKLKEGRQAAVGLLNSYIDFIEQYSKIAAQRSQIKEQSFQETYYGLLGKYNPLVGEYNKLMDEYSAVMDEKVNMVTQLEECEQKNKHLIQNTLQLDNVTFRRLWMGIQNLPTTQIVSIISIMVVLLIAAFKIGQLIEKNNANNESFGLKTESNELKGDLQKAKTQIDSQTATIKLQADSIEKLNKPADLTK